MKKRRTKLSQRATYQAAMRRMKTWSWQADDYSSHVITYRTIMNHNDRVEEAYYATLDYPGHHIVGLDWYDAWHLTPAMTELWQDDHDEGLCRGVEAWWDDAVGEARAIQTTKSFKRMGYHPGNAAQSDREYLNKIREAMDAPEIVAVGMGYDSCVKWSGRREDDRAQRLLKFVFKSDHDAVLFALKWQG